MAWLNWIFKKVKWPSDAGGGWKNSPIKLLIDTLMAVIPLWRPDGGNLYPNQAEQGN